MLLSCLNIMHGDINNLKPDMRASPFEHKHIVSMCQLHKQVFKIKGKNA